MLPNVSPPVLDDLLNDKRLARLFSRDGCNCALQLWILQIKSDQTIENRIVYGRLLPYRYFNQNWSSTDDDIFDTFGQVQAQVIRLNLYLKSDCCEDLLRQLSIGRSISETSEELKLGLSEKLKARFGATALSTDKLVYRPVVYLINRDANDRKSPSSPHGGAGAYSASISQTDKGALFRLTQDYDVALTASVVNHLNADTGMDFGGTDTARFGDIELLVFPTLDDLERPLLNVSWTDLSRTLVVQFNSMQLQQFSGFQFRLSISNGGQIDYSEIATAERNEEGLFECKFDINDQLRARTDSTELEIFGFQDDHYRAGTLCCRWRVGYIREVNIQGNIASASSNPVKFDWLENTTRTSMRPRVNEVLTINRGKMGFTNHIGGREADPWIPPNRNLTSLFERLHPPKSEGRFFQRWSQGDGDGRLQFVEWFKSLLDKYQQHQIVIFDPYFDTAGLDLILRFARQNANYIVFTSLPKPPKEDETNPGDTDKPTPDRINNLVANCEQSSHRLKNIKLRIYGLKNGRLHDRYILVVGSDKLPVAGFNLSNSLQKAAEHYPLLITPIPADTLLDVENYKSDLVKEAHQSSTPESENENLSMRLLFNSMGAPTVPRRYEPLRFLEKTLAGDVLSELTGESSLKGLSGDRLKEKLSALKLIMNDSLALPETADLSNFLKLQGEDFEDFTTTWEVLGDVLAHSHIEDRDFTALVSKNGFLEFLRHYLGASFKRAYAEDEKELTLTNPQLFLEPIETLLHKSYHLDYLFHPTKYIALTWAEYYAIRILWRHAPSVLLTITEDQIAELRMESQSSEVMRLSLLGQIVSEVSLSVQFNLSDRQRDRLLCSNNGLLHCMGLNAIEMELQKPDGLPKAIQLMANFTYVERVRALGWMVHHVARNPEKAEVYKGLVAALHEALPMKIHMDDLRQLVNSMRGYMRELCRTEPWLFEDVVFPLLKNERAHTNDACEIWIQELATLLEPEPKQRPSLFDREREGQSTITTAFLFASSTPERQQVSLKQLQAILKRKKRIIHQPLASTSDWTRWNDALVVSMWILTFARWGQYFLSKHSVACPVLEMLSRDAQELAMVRSMDEWHFQGPRNEGQLAKFLDQVEELIRTSNSKDQQGP